jgi:hypothetical protein
MKKWLTLLLAAAFLIVSCTERSGIPGAAGDHEAPPPTTGPRLAHISEAKCRNAVNGPITIWAESVTGYPQFICAAKVIVSLSEDHIAYDGAAKPLDEVYSLVTDVGKVYTTEELRNSDWPDTIDGEDEGSLFDGKVSNLSPAEQARLRALLEYAATRTSYLDEPRGGDDG